MEISLIISILSAAATAAWTVWTWGEQQNIERQEKRERLAASYVNPFLLAAESLQYRLYNLLYQEDMFRRSNLVQNTSGFVSPLTLETLYRFALYFGCENYLIRYSPYTHDRPSIEISRQVALNFVDIENFPDSYFSFSLSEQLSLGQLVVKPIGSRDGEFPSVEAIDIYRFEDELRAARDNDSPLWRSPGVRAAIEALEAFSRGEPLKGCQRLEAILLQLVQLLQYLEKKEGFSVALQEERFSERLSRSRQGMTGAGTTEVVHKTAGRIRLRVPRSRSDERYAERLLEKIRSLAGVTEVSLNRPSASLTVHYSSSAWRDWETFLISFIEREITSEGV
ncbi:HMA2 domain-containing protein [Pannus brasiliensis]|uniref:HMA2 domain-containing protein n=1 Tax=Pannus brasiliensis TaxID=1579216 RepID=UPI002FCDC62E